MYNSIPKKKCKHEGCTKWPTLGMNGFCWEHGDEKLKEKLGSKRNLYRKNSNSRKAQVLKLKKVQRELEGGNNLELWFMARRQEMTGVCMEAGCAKETNKGSDKYYRWSVCHIVPKALVPSVATNFLNWIELCQDHHNEFDNTFERASKMDCFTEAKRRFNLFKCLIPSEELRKINPYLLN